MSQQETESPPSLTGPFRRGRTARHGQAYDTWQFVCAACGASSETEFHCLAKPTQAGSIRFNEFLEAFICRQCDNRLCRDRDGILSARADEFSRKDPEFMRLIMLRYLQGLTKLVAKEARRKKASLAECR